MAVAILPASVHASSAPKSADAPVGPYLRIPVLTASIVKANGKRGVLTVETGVFTTDTALRARAEASVPRLRAGYVQVLQIYANGLSPGAPPNPDFLGQELQRETDRILGKGGAKVLFSTLLMN